MKNFALFFDFIFQNLTGHIFMKAVFIKHIAHIGEFGIFSDVKIKLAVI